MTQDTPKTQTPPSTNRARIPGGRALALVLMLSAGLLAAGLALPALEVSSFGFMESSVSILGGIDAFRDDGQVFLAGLLFLVSAVFPALKILIGIGLALVFNPARQFSHRLAGALAELARWSMTDVFILAVAVMVIDARLISSADLGPGAYLFAGGVLLSSFAVHILRRRLRRHAAELKI